MFRQCTDATEAVAKLLEKRLPGLGLQCAIIQGRWTDRALPDRFRLAARATGFMTPLNKRDHQWLAVGNADRLLKDVNNVETLESWYEDAVKVDPTCFQFSKEDEDWTIDPCLVDAWLVMKPVATLERLRMKGLVGPLLMPLPFDDVSGNGGGMGGGVRRFRTCSKGSACCRACA